MFCWRSWSMPPGWALEPDVRSRGSGVLPYISVHVSVVLIFLRRSWKEATGPVLSRLTLLYGVVLLKVISRRNVLSARNPSNLVAKALCGVVAAGASSVATRFETWTNSIFSRAMIFRLAALARFSLVNVLCETFSASVPFLGNIGSPWPAAQKEHRAGAFVSSFTWFITSQASNLEVSTDSSDASILATVYFLAHKLSIANLLWIDSAALCRTLYRQRHMHYSRSTLDSIISVKWRWTGKLVFAWL